MAEVAQGNVAETLIVDQEVDRPSVGQKRSREDRMADGDSDEDDMDWSNVAMPVAFAQFEKATSVDPEPQEDEFLRPRRFHPDVRALYEDLQALDSSYRKERATLPGNGRPVRFTVTCFAADTLSPEDTAKTNGKGLTPLYWHLPSALWAQVKSLVVGFYAHHPRDAKITQDCPAFAVLWFKLVAATEVDAKKIYDALSQHRTKMLRTYRLGYVQAGGLAPEKACRPGTKTPLPDPNNPDKEWLYFIPAPTFRVTKVQRET